MSQSLTDHQQCTLTIAPTGPDGSPAAVTDVVWISSNPNIAAVLPQPTNPLTAELITISGAGTATIHVQATMGGVLVTETLDIIVTHTDAVDTGKLNITVSNIRQKGSSL